METIQTIAESCLDYGIDIHGYGSSNFLSAIRFKFFSLAYFLLMHGANLHANDDEALRMAASNGNITTVQWLLNMGANPNAKEDESLIQAIRKNNVDMVRLILDKMKKVKHPSTLLLHPCHHHHMAMVQCLLQKRIQHPEMVCVTSRNLVDAMTCMKPGTNTVPTVGGARTGGADTCGTKECDVDMLTLLLDHAELVVIKDPILVVTAVVCDSEQGLRLLFERGAPVQPWNLSLNSVLDIWCLQFLLDQIERAQKLEHEKDIFHIENMQKMQKWMDDLLAMAWSKVENSLHSYILLAYGAVLPTVTNAKDSKNDKKNATKLSLTKDMSKQAANIRAYHCLRREYEAAVKCDETIMEEWGREIEIMIRCNADDKEGDEENKEDVENHLWPSPSSHIMLQGIVANDTLVKIKRIEKKIQEVRQMICLIFNITMDTMDEIY